MCTLTESQSVSILLRMATKRRGPKFLRDQVAQAIAGAHASLAHMERPTDLQYIYSGKKELGMASYLIVNCQGCLQALTMEIE